MRFIMQTCPQREEVFRDTIAHAPPTTEIIVDDGGGNLRTFLRVLESAADCEFVFMEDDLIFSNGFEEKVCAAIGNNPFMVTAFFSFRKDMQGDRGPTLHLGSRFWSNLCVHYPRGAAESILKFHEDRRDSYESRPHGDLLVREWLMANGLWFVHHAPNLVQHKDGPSVSMAGNRHVRRSETFAG